MKKYKCHKVVEAMKIKSIAHGENSSEVISDDYSVTVDKAWVEKVNPEVGGYFVRYEDGYKSYSPASPFEEGYSPVGVIDFITESRLYRWSVLAIEIAIVAYFAVYFYFDVIVGF